MDCPGHAHLHGSRCHFHRPAREREPDAAHPLFCTLQAPTPARTWGAGTDATITLAPSFYAPPRITVTDVRRRWTATANFGQTGQDTGLAWQAAHVPASIADGRRESRLLPLDETVAIARSLDKIRGELDSEGAAGTAPIA